MDRRSFLQLTSAYAVSRLVPGCGAEGNGVERTVAGPAPPVTTGPVRAIALDASPARVVGPTGTFELSGYQGQVPGPELRVAEGDLLEVTLTNRLADPTTIHWHGVPVPNAMDGVPELTQSPVAPREAFLYRFPAWPAGTYFFHSHAGYQLDQGLYAPLVIEAPDDPAVDLDQVLVLEDHATVDGGGPAASAAGDTASGPGRGMGRGMGRMGPDRSDDDPLLEPRYDVWSINGKLTGDGEVVRTRRGQRLRLRLINAASATTHVFRVAGHRLTVTHADGRPVQPVTVDAVRLGMGERYDVQVDADRPGRWPLLLWPDTGTGPIQAGLLEYADASATGISGDDAAPLNVLGYRDLVALEEPDLPVVGSRVDRTFRLVLSWSMHGLAWTLNGQTWPDTEDLRIDTGERVRLEYVNQSPMPHPMHLHGHFFELDLPGRPRKDTALVAAHGGTLAVEFVADNPGAWFHHCHNLYHMLAGMAQAAYVG